jgi:hypothetical protein
LAHASAEMATLSLTGDGQPDESRRQQQASDQQTGGCETWNVLQAAENERR